MNRIRFQAAALLAGAALAVSTSAQQWETAATQGGDPRFHRPDYPVCFVSNRGQADGATFTPPRFGLDVIEAGNPAPMGSGGGLWCLLPGGVVRKIFPLPVHEPLIDTPPGELWRGAVVEPNVSEDGRRVYFAYFHDATWELNGGGFHGATLSFKGADLYRLELGPLIDDNGFDPARLVVRRLTSKRYDGPPKANVRQAVQDRDRQAMNPALAAYQSSNYHGTVDMHPVEMRTVRGLRLVWVSNRARLGNSNSEQTDANHDFNLYVADLLPDGTLGPEQQFQYYTTTSALSPIPLRNGIAFSYQSSTEGFRRWDIQSVTSEGKWAPLIGYAHLSELFHLGSMATVLDPAGRREDWFIGVKYYNLNDGGFGQLHKLRLADAGINRFVPGYWATTPAQLSSLLTIGARALDGPSARVFVDGKWRYIGKFSSARCGRLGGEYFMAYTPTSANTWLPDADGRFSVFESEIAYRPNLEPFQPHDPIDVQNGKGLYAVVRDASRQYDLLWPTPVLSWMERFGTPRQDFSTTIVQSGTPIERGLPFAEVGTSAIYNTDVRPYDCYLGSTGTHPYSPNAVNANEEIALTESLEGLRYVQDRGDFCAYLRPETVLGIALNITSDKPDLDAQVAHPYETDGPGKKEAVELLGVYAIAEQNQSDYSFLARVPANVPFDFHLLDSRYGMKLVDVRSWHSLKPRERRTDCGGCHQHEAGTGIPFEGKEASRKPALDMTSQTRYVEYDANCRPRLTSSATPVRTLFEWKADIWPGFQKHCGGCHDATRSHDVAALAALDFVDEESAYDALRERHYASSAQGALGSPAFWAAYGQRTDGRDNNLPVYRPDYLAGVWGYRFSAIHATSPGLCAAANPDQAQWVRRLGQWIDNHMPRNTGKTPYGYKFDRFHPAADFGPTDDGLGLRFGWWDDRGTVDVQIEIGGRGMLELHDQPNGSIVLGLPRWLTLPMVIKLVATDPAGNRQIAEKTVRQLVQEFHYER